MYAVLGVTLAFAAFAAAQLVGGLLSRAAWRRLGPALANAPARRRANALFGLCVLPAALALGVAAGLVAPAYLLHEPPATGETPGAVLLAFALLGVGLAASALGRLAGMLHATRRFLADRLRGARALRLPGSPARCYGVRHEFPAVSLVGVARPRVLLAERVLAALDADELSAVLAHEAGHAAARDNLKALALRAVPRWGGPGPALERLWREAAELAADDHAIAGRADRALALAAALVKVARLAPEEPGLDLPAIAFHSGAGVSGRVLRLLRSARHDAERAPSARRWSRRSWLLALAIPLAAALPELLWRVHLAIELLVNRLP